MVDYVLQHCKEKKKKKKSSLRAMYIEVQLMK